MLTKKEQKIIEKATELVLQKHAGKSLRDSDILDEDSIKLVQLIDFEKLGPDQVFERIDVRTKEISRYYRYCVLGTYVPILLLLLSISGVEFRVSLLGISLSNLSNLSEIILIEFALLGYIASALEITKKKLVALRKQLFITVYGKDMFDGLSVTFNPVIASIDFASILNHSRYQAVGTKNVLEKIHTIIAAAIAFSLVGLIAYISIAVMTDIWLNPNWPSFISRFLVIVIGVYFLLTGYVMIAKEASIFRYIDLEKVDELQLNDPETNEIKEVFRDEYFDVYQKLEHETKRNRIIYLLVILILFAVAAFVFYSKS